jgi:hypothetical protein
MLAVSNKTAQIVLHSFLSEYMKFLVFLIVVYNQKNRKDDYIIFCDQFNFRFMLFSKGRYIRYHECLSTIIYYYKYTPKV